MEGYIVDKYGIRKVSGKVVKRFKKGGIMYQMFRLKSPDGREYPLRYFREKLTEEEQYRYDIQSTELEIEELKSQLHKYPEDTQNIKVWLAEAEERLRYLISKGK